MGTILALPMVMLMSFTLVHCWHVPRTINLFFFSLFKLSMLADIQALVSLIVFSSSVIQSVCEPDLDSLKERCSCWSYAKSWNSTESDLQILPRGLVYIVKSTGPRTKPWGTPKSRSIGSDHAPFVFLSPITTLWVLPMRYDYPV